MVEINQSILNEKTIDEEFSEEEKNNIREIDELVNKFIRIEEDTNKTLEFVLSEKVPRIEKEYMGKKYIQYRFTVIDVSTGRVKKLDIGKKATVDIVNKLNEGYKVLNLKRTGKEKNTKYIITPVSENSE